MNNVKLTTSSIVAKRGYSGAVFGQVGTNNSFNVANLKNIATSITCSSNYCGGVFGYINANNNSFIVFSDMTSDITEISGNNYTGGFGGSLNNVAKMNFTRIDNHIGLIKMNKTASANYFGGLFAELNINATTTGGAIDFYLIRSDVDKFDFSSLRNSSAFIANIRTYSSGDSELNMSDVLSVVHEAIKEGGSSFTNYPGAGFVYDNSFRGKYNADRVVSLAQLPSDSRKNAVLSPIHIKTYLIPKISTGIALVMNTNLLLQKI